MMMYCLTAMNLHQFRTLLLLIVVLLPAAIGKHVNPSRWKPSTSNKAQSKEEVHVKNTRADNLLSIGDRRAREIRDRTDGKSPSTTKNTNTPIYSPYMKFIMRQEGDGKRLSNKNFIVDKINKDGDRVLGTADDTDDYPEPYFDDDAHDDDDWTNGLLCYQPSESYQYYNRTCVADTYTVPPSCLANTSDLVFDSSGQLSSMQTFYRCLANVYDAAEPPTMYDGSYHGCLNIYTIMTLLNLVKVSGMLIVSA